MLFRFWSIILFVVMADIFFEFYTGYNSRGFKYMPGRLTSFFGDELVVGGYFSAFSLIILAFMQNTLKNKNLGNLDFEFLTYLLNYI